MNNEEFLKQVESMTAVELNELVKALEEKFGVSVATMISAGASAGSESASAEEEKDEYSVVLKEVGQAKIQVIKAIRELTGMGLKDVKDLTDKAPVEVKTGVKKVEADEIKKKLEEAGATIELK